MVESKPFSAYLAAARSKYGVGTSKPIAAPKASAFKPSKAVSAAKTGNVQDPLSWLIDIASRPMRAIQNPINQTLNEISKAETEGANYDVLGGIGNVLTASPRGFWSNNPEDQPYGAQLIEKATDVAGQLNDPRYENVQDNVNPWVKGIGGFGLDVGLDPLTYIPGGVIASGTRGAIAAAKAATGAEKASAALKGIVAGTGETTYKIGSITKQMKPVGVKQWQETKDFTKLNKLANSNNIPVESLLRFTEGDDVASIVSGINKGLAAKAAEAGKAAKVVTPETFLQTFNKGGKFIEGAKFYDTRLQSVDAAKRLAVAQEAAANAAKEAAKASDNAAAGRATDEFVAPREDDFANEILQTTEAPKAPTASASIAERMQGMSAEGKVAAVLKEAMDAKAQVTEAGRVKPFDEWRSAEIAKAKVDPTHTVKYPAGIDINERSYNAGALNSSKLTQLERLGTDPKSTTIRDQIESKLRDSYDEYVTSLGGVKAPKASGLKEWLLAPENRAVVSEALGEKALAQVGRLKEETVAKATDFLSRALNGEEDFSGVTKFGQTQEQLFAKNVLDEYSKRIPGVPAIPVQATSRVAEPVVAPGKTLVDEPWAEGLESAEEAEFVLAAVKSFWADKLLKRLSLPFTSPNGARKSEAAMMEGTADWINQFNGVDQIILFRKFMEPVLRRVGAKNADLRDKELFRLVVAGGRRANQVSTEIERQYTAARRLIDSGLGVSAWIGKGDAKIPMYFDQLISTLEDVAVGGEAGLLNRHLVNMAMYNKETGIPFTLIDDVVAAKVLNPDSVGIDEIKAILRTETPDGTFNVITQGTLEGRYGFIPGKSKPAAAAGLRFEAKPSRKNPKEIAGWYVKVVPAEFEEAFAKLINDAAPKLQEIVELNKANAAARTNAEYMDITPQLWDRITNVVLSSDDMATGIRTAANVSEAAAEVGAKGHALFDSQANAARDVADLLANDTIHDSQRLVKNEKIYNETVAPQLSAAAGDAATKEKLAKAAWEDTKYTRKMAEERIAANKNAVDGVAPNGNVFDEDAFEGAKHRETIELRIQRLNKFFHKGAGAEDVLQPWIFQEANFSKGIHRYNSGLAAIAKKYGGPIAKDSKTTIVQQALRDIAINRLDDPLTAEAVTALKPFVERVFGTKDNPALTSIWLMGEASFADFEAYVTRASKVEFPFDMDQVARWAKASGEPSLVVEAMKHWGEWASLVDNPLDFLERMHYGAMRMISDKALADSLQGIRGGSSMKPAVGFTRVGKGYEPMANPLLSHLPQDLYIADELLPQLKRLEEIMTESSQYRGVFADFVNNKYMPILSNWKVSVTILRLGHHVRNLFSSKSIQAILEGPKNFVRAELGANKVLMAHRSYPEVDFAKQAQNLKLTEMPKSGDKVFESKRFGVITTDAINDAFEKKGLFEEVKAIEDVMGDTATPSLTQKVSNVMAFRNTPIEKAGSTLSEYVAHQARLAHGIQIMMNEADSGLYKTWDELMDAVAERVRRAHPSSMTLASGEKNLRLAFPFYSWFRQAMPVILEGIVTQPGRFMMIPKASFNLAIGMGVNPYQMYDPFPQDQPFPSFITDQLLGPIAKVNGKYYSINPGFAPVDILNQFVPDPIRGIAGMATPFIKVPAEILGGSSWSTGARINDMSDYWDAQIPGINYLSNMTGTSTTGSVASLLQGKGLDPQYSVSKGNKTPLDQGISISNWFTGAGLQNLSKENYINYAELEKRNRAIQEASGRSAF